MSRVSYQMPSAHTGSDLRIRVSRQQFQDLVDESILRTVAYGDVFDFPMTVMEICRYMVGLSVLPYTISSALIESDLLRQQLDTAGGYVYLRGREDLVGIRSRRAALASSLWPAARRYGRMIAALPFVRMVAVTGSLAVDNPGEDDDIDYFLVASPGRVWLCRSMVIALVKWAGLWGTNLCPNYVLSENNLWHIQKDIYTAHELTQMVPLAGMSVYEKMRFANLWSFKYLPNTYGSPPATRGDTLSLATGWVKDFGEKCLSGGLGDSLEKWEMDRKIERFSRMVEGSGEAEFSAKWCKGHFDRHARQTNAAYDSRLAELGLGPLTDRFAALFGVENVR